MRGGRSAGQSRGGGKSHSRERPNRTRPAQSGKSANKIIEYTNSGLTSSYESSNIDQTAKNMNVKIIGKTNSSHYGSRSVGNFTKLTENFQSGISVSHKHM